MSLPPLPCEAALLEALPTIELSEPGRALVISPGRAQSAWWLSRTYPAAQVRAWSLDLHHAGLARAAAAAESTPVEVVCAADLPEQPLDVVLFAVSAHGEAELTRDLLQQAQQRLVDGGLLVTAVDQPRDRFLQEQLEVMFDKVVAIDTSGGRAYWARKTRPLKKVKRFDCEFAFRDEGTLVKVVSRPGVFAHRRLDAGARQLLHVVSVESGQRVVDLGCGSGGVGLATALRAPDVTVFAVDSNMRAVECAARGAELNDIATFSTIANSDGQLGLDDSIDLVLANPPYFADFGVAEHFLTTAYRALRPGGALLMVTKHPAWYEQRMPELLEDVELIPSGNYHVACGRKPEH